MSENEMLCKTCRRWADGWCLAQQMGMSSNKVCNAWELSPVVDWVSEKDALNARIAELEEENDRLQDAWFNDETICPDGSLKPKVSDFLNRIAKLEAVIDQLIEAGEKMFTAVIAAAVPYDEGMREWDKIVNDWKEG